MEYKVKNIHQYIRKSFKSLRGLDSEGPEERPSEPARRDAGVAGGEAPTCAHDTDSELDIASILHKKCAVITLAEEQLNRLRDNTPDQSLDRASRFLFAYYFKYRHLLEHGHLSKLILLMAMMGTFFLGLLLGSASCGIHLGKFNSPLLDCINSMFIKNDYLDIEHVFIGIA